jgi:hypothetical protein
MTLGCGRAPATITKTMKMSELRITRKVNIVSHIVPQAAPVRAHKSATMDVIRENFRL